MDKSTSAPSSASRFAELTKIQDSCETSGGKQVLERDYLHNIGQNQSTTIHATIYCPEKVDPHKVKVLSHGFAATGLFMAPLAKLWQSSGWKVVALDHIGHGKSGLPPEEAFQYDDFFAYGEEISTVLRKETHDSADLVCHSMGSGICLAATLKHPEQVSNLTLITPWLWTVWQSKAPEGKPWLVKLMIGTPQSLLNSLALVTSRPHKAGLRNNPEIQKMVRDATRAWNEPLQTLSPTGVRYPTPDVRYHTSQIRSAPLIRALLANPEILRDKTVTVISGGKDGLTPLEHGAFIAALAQTSWHVFTRAGHQLPHERSAEIVKIVDASSSKIRGKSHNDSDLIHVPIAVAAQLSAEAQLPPPDRTVVRPWSKHHVSLRQILTALFGSSFNALISQANSETAASLAK